MADALRPLRACAKYGRESHDGDAAFCTTCGGDVVLSNPATPDLPLTTIARIGRARFFWTTLLITLAVGVAEGVVILLGNAVFGAPPAESKSTTARVSDWILSDFVPGAGAAFFSCFPAIGRLHDLDRPGRKAWLLLVPLVGMFHYFELLFKRGTVGPNQYGPDPLETPSAPRSRPARPSVTRAAWIGAIALLALTVLGRSMAAFAPAEDPRSQAVLAEMAARTNKNLPISVDNDTELVATEGLSGVFSYTYRLVNITASEVDSGKMLATLKQQTVKLVCGSSAGPDFPRQGVTMRFSYLDRDRNALGTIDVKPAECVP